MSNARYARPLIALHWLTLVLLAFIYACMEFRGLFPRGSDPRELMKALHYSAGLSLLLVVLVRAVLRARNPAPPITPPLSMPQRLAARAGHLALYAFMLCMPVLGWLLLSAEGTAIRAWGLPLPALITPDPALGSQIKELHETMATVGYALIGLHALAGLYHHYVRRDDALRRMLPGPRA